VFEATFASVSIKKLPIWITDVFEQQVVEK
jgi:hypothetical protein